jgi:UDP-N-acetylmuramate--alanine ligase
VDPIFVPEKTGLLEIVSSVIRDNDVLLMQGAGDIGALALDLAGYGLEVPNNA